MQETRISINLFVRKNDAQCEEAKKLVKDLVAELPDIRFSLEDIDIDNDTITALAHQVYSTPSISINGATKFHGVIPRKDELKKEIDKERAF
jgi:hypothetical protein